MNGYDIVDIKKIRYKLTTGEELTFTNLAYVVENELCDRIDYYCQWFDDIGQSHKIIKSVNIPADSVLFRSIELREGLYV